MAAKKLRKEAMCHCTFQGKLYKKGLSLPLLRASHEATKLKKYMRECAKII